MLLTFDRGCAAKDGKGTDLARSEILHRRIFIHWETGLGDLIEELAHAWYGKFRDRIC